MVFPQCPDSLSNPDIRASCRSNLLQGSSLTDASQILYSMPLAASRLEDINDAQSKCGDKAVIRLMVDHPDQIAALEAFSKRSGRKQRWSVFMKVDGGGR
jgi:D-serine deaminase-like pyridoxal phosphate-dependent protein